MKTSAHHLHRAGHLDVAHVQHHPENKGRNRSVSTARLKVERELGRVRANGTPGISPERLASTTGVPLKSVRRILQTLRMQHAAVNTGTTMAPLWRPSRPGDHVRTQAELPINNSTVSGDYIPVELRPFDGRPGAMDAFSLPSVVNGKPVPARRATAQCVGVLADKRNSAGD